MHNRHSHQREHSDCRYAARPRAGLTALALAQDVRHSRRHRQERPDLWLRPYPGCGAVKERSGSLSACVGQRAASLNYYCDVRPAMSAQHPMADDTVVSAPHFS